MRKRNIEVEEDWGGMRNPEQRRLKATGEHSLVTDPNGVRQGYTRSEMTGVKDRFMDDGVRRMPGRSESTF